MKRSGRREGGQQDHMVKLGEPESKLFEPHDYDKSAAAAAASIVSSSSSSIPLQRVGCHCVFQCLTELKQRSWWSSSVDLVCLPCGEMCLLVFLVHAEYVPSSFETFNFEHES